MYRFKRPAQILGVVLVVLFAFAITTKSDGTFDPTTDGETMKKRLAHRIGVAERESARAAKKTKREVKRQQRAIKRATGGSSGSVNKNYERSMKAL